MKATLLSNRSSVRVIPISPKKNPSKRPAILAAAALAHLAEQYRRKGVKSVEKAGHA